MKAFRQTYQDRLSSTTPRIVPCLRVEALDGRVLRVTMHDEILPIGRSWDGSSVNSRSLVEYRPDRAGVDGSAVQISTGLDSAKWDLTTALLDNGVNREDLQAGKWDFATVRLFRTLWDDPVEDDDPLMEGRFGSITIEDSRFTTEVRSLASLLNTSIGRSHEPLCAWELGDSRCGIDLPSFEVSGMIDDVRDSGLTVEDSSLSGSKPDDFYGRGELRIDSGPNAGDARVIKDYDSTGVITLWQPFFFELSAGETYRMVPGCRKRKEKDCRDKYNNVKRHGGFADMPLEDDTSKFGKPRR